MKKFLLIACCAVFVVGFTTKRTTSTLKSRKPLNTATVAQQNVGRSLNGIDSVTAISLIKNFKDNPTSKVNATSIWFSKTFVDDICDILNAQKSLKHCDGVRLHIGKDGSGNNTLVILSTYDGGIYPDNPKPRTGKMHVDYFQHGYAILNSREVKNEDTYSVKLGDGADLYQDTIKKPCQTETCQPSDSHVPCLEAKGWVQAFKSEKLDTRSVWYSLELINYLRDQLHAGIVNGKSMDGIRIYFAKDPSRNKNGFLITPTEEVNGVHQDFYGCYYLHKFFDIVNHGEECPIFCKGPILQ